MVLQVRKRDGSLEEFDRGKIYRGVVAAGLSEERAESLSSEVEAWAEAAAEDEVISSLEIGGKVLELLREWDPGVATRFEEYRKG